MPLLIALLVAAAAPSHREKAGHAEALGRMAEAAREYEAAWEEEKAPDLLYRLGIVRRKLKQYGKAREALRAYLREAPEGGLRDEVERQLAKLEVLIEAQSEDYADEPPRRPAKGPAPPPARAPGPAAPAPSPAPSVPAPAPAGASEQRSLPQREEVNNVHQPTVAAPPTTPAPAPGAVPVPSAAVAPAVSPAASAPGRSRVAPWLVAGAAVAGAAGGYLWWDGSRLSRDLDARFAAGDLAPADRPSYDRAHNESLAGRVLVVAAIGLVAGAVALWW